MQADNGKSADSEAYMYNNPKCFLSAIQLEFSNKNIESFIFVVGNAYKTSFNNSIVGLWLLEISLSRGDTFEQCMTHLWIYSPLCIWC